jgi:hypothetical protein
MNTRARRRSSAVKFDINEVQLTLNVYSSMRSIYANNIETSLSTMKIDVFRLVIDM